MDKRDAVYAAVVVFVTIVTGFVGSLLYTNHVAAQAQEAQRAQSAAALAITCKVVTAQIAVYDETPPTTDTGRNAERSWREMRIELGCP